MKVYGFDETDIVRGELRANAVDACEMRYHPDEVQGRFDWEFLSARFVEARAELIARMEAAEIDSDLVDPIRKMKASFVPVDNE